MRAAIILAGLLGAAQPVHADDRSAPRLPEGIEWPTPAGWRREVIPFPLDFAPSLKHKGVEEIRFAPKFFDPKAPGYWSYAFAWILEDAPPLAAKQLGDELQRYFAGLCAAVGKEKRLALDPGHFRAALTAQPGGGLHGSVSLYDVFVTGKELTLHVEAEPVECVAAKRHALLILASPRPVDDPVWKELRARRVAFRCR